MKKKILAGVLATASLLTTASLTGCNDSGRTPKISDDDKTLTVVAWTDHGDVQKLVDLFKEANPDVDVVFKGVGTGGGGARQEYEKFLDSGEDADIILCDAEWTQKFVCSDMTVPLKDIGVDASTFGKNAYAYTVSIGKDKAGNVVGTTYQACAGCYVYNAAKAKKYLDVDTPEQMQDLMKDWETAEKTAERLAAQGVSLFASEGGLWEVWKCGKDTKWVVDEKLNLDDKTASFVQMVKDWMDKGYLSKDEQWGDPWKASVRSEEKGSLGDFAPTWGLINSGSSIADGFSNGDGSLALCDGPQGWYWGGTWMCPTYHCNSSSLAKKWFEFYASPEGLKAYAELTGDFVNDKTVMKELAESKTLVNKLYKDGQHQYDVLYKAADNIKLTVTEYDGDIKEQFNKAVQAYAVQGEYDSASAAIEGFKKAVKGIFEDLDVGL